MEALNERHVSMRARYFFDGHAAHGLGRVRQLRRRARRDAGGPLQEGVNVVERGERLEEEEEEEVEEEEEEEEEVEVEEEEEHTHTSVNTQYKHTHNTHT